MTINWIPLDSCGYIGFDDSLPDGRGVRTARKFLRGIIEQLCIQAAKYHCDFGNNHFLRFNERLMYSQMAVAINSLTTLHISEESLTRRQSNASASGRADFWAYYQKMDILLELKQCYFSVKDGAKTKSVSERVGSVIDQAHSLKLVAKGWGEKASLIGLCVALPYCKRNSKEKIDEVKNKPGNTPKSLGKEFVDSIRSKNRANFVAVWLPPSNMLIYRDDPKKCIWEYDPFVGFAAKVISLSKS